MNDKNVSALNSEVELSNAVAKINESIADLEKLKKASATLEEVGKKNTELAEHLFRVSDSLKDATQYLSQEGIRKFNKTLEQMGDSIRSTLSAHQRETLTQIQAQFEKLEADLAETLKANSKTQEKNIGGMIDSVKVELNSKIKMLQIYILILGIGGMGLLGYIAFFRGG